MAEGKKKKSNGGDEVQRPQASTAGEILRAARIQKGVGLEEISAAINIRVGQLRAIEEGNLSALPGMTYATGFVKSYAGFLKLNSAELVQKFKAEHGAASPAAQNLHYPEPLPDGPRPNIFIIGVAVFFALIVLGAWAIFSGGGDKAAKVAEQIPPAPAVGTVTGITETPAPPPATTTAGANLLSAPAPAVTAPPPVTPEAAPAPVADTGPVILPVKPDRTQKAPEAAADQQQPQPAPPVIRIRSGKSRITLTAKQDSWVEIRSANKEVVLQKVLRTGDQFFVPDQPGQTLITTNAGGLVVTVDGAEVQPLGIRGEIVRGVELNPDELKIVKVKARDR